MSRPHEVPLRSGCADRCPGCTHRFFSAKESELQKSQWLGRALGPWIDALEPLRGVQGERRWNYREKSLLHARWNGTEWEFGMRIWDRAQGRRDYEIIPIPDCPVHSDRVRVALKLLAKELPSVERFPLVFVSVSGALVTLVLKCAPSELPDLQKSLASLGSSLLEAGIRGIFVNFSASAGHRVFASGGWRHVWGDQTSIGPHGLSHGPQSFQQQISELHDDALKEAEKWLSPQSGDFVLDLYSGLGASVRLWHGAGAETLGVELLGEAVELSEKSLPGAILRGRVSERIPQIEEKLGAWKKSREGKFLAFMNPPRTGLESEVLSWLDQEEPRPERIAYLSCSAGTLDRDLSRLANLGKRGYRVTRIIPYDFFPQTQHVETLACLELDPDRCVSGSVSGERFRRNH